MPDHHGTCLSLLLQLGVSAACKYYWRLCVLTFSKRVCVCVVYKPTQILAWEPPLEVLVLHTESNNREECGGGERGRRREEQQMLSWGLDCCCLFENRVRRREEERRKAQGVRGGS